MQDLRYQECKWQIGGPFSSNLTEQGFESCLILKPMICLWFALNFQSLALTKYESGGSPVVNATAWEDCWWRNPWSSPNPVLGGFGKEGQSSRQGENLKDTGGSSGRGEWKAKTGGKAPDLPLCSLLILPHLLLLMTQQSHPCMKREEPVAQNHRLLETSSVALPPGFQHWPRCLMQRRWSINIFSIKEWLKKNRLAFSEFYSFLFSCLLPVFTLE